MATPPRQVLPNQLFYVTARTVTRSMRLRPDPNTVRTVAYCLAVVSERHRRLGKLVLHEFVFMSNHYWNCLEIVDGWLCGACRGLGVDLVLGRARVAEAR
ncbi:MAG: hypothetical protein D6705_17050, partial [Deltaproteobacteria bacterium]